MPPSETLDQTSVLDTFIHHLTEVGAVFERAPLGAIRVQGDLVVPRFGPTALPEQLTVEGKLDLRASQITRLPEGLKVGQSLALTGHAITGLPRTLSVAGDLWLGGSCILSLPEGFRVGGSLYLHNTPIVELPEGLDVGGQLFLPYTTIVRFPKNLHVGDRITPPATLLDIESFMQGKDDVCLHLHGSHHQRLEMMAQLHPFPDLLRVLRSIGSDHHLRLRRGEKYKIQVSFDRRNP